MTNFGGDNPIGGSGGGPSRPPQGFPPPAPRPAPPQPDPFTSAPASSGGNFGGGFGNRPPGPAGPPQPQGDANPPGHTPFQGGAAFGAPSFEPPSYSSAPPKNRRKLFGIIAGVVVLVVAVVVGFVVIGGSSTDATTASGAVEGYLKALAKGDAEKALSMGINQPPDKTFLTDEVLKRQIEKMPITDIKILGEDEKSVHVTANFGDEAIDVEIYVKQSSDGLFKVEYPTYALNFGKAKAKGKAGVLDSLNILGKPLPDTGIAYLFPGAVEVTSTNPYIAIEYRRASYMPPDGWQYQPPEEDADFELEITEEGKKAASKAILDALGECAKSSALNPPKCPAMENTFESDYGLVDGTAHWTAPANTDDVSVKLEPLLISSGEGLDGHASVEGNVELKLTAQGKNPADSVTDQKVTSGLGGYVDLTKNPPTYIYE